MHQPGNDVLAGPAFAMDEHRNVRGRNLGQSITKGMHGVAIAKNDRLRWYLTDGLDQRTDRICRCARHKGECGSLPPWVDAPHTPNYCGKKSKVPISA